MSEDTEEAPRANVAVEENYPDDPDDVRIQKSSNYDFEVDQVL